ncbi:hypothetical protein OED52_13900 [Rhodococcus sp. Z13]|uniref:Uncharacterized protein n=1 Tax=Rhodococcus sacchari TaxID=2962047 RepID=A0ACD4DCG9_9NOCA|nr:hypothetical protein [Rhodococcus sp. Z13]UYP17765.1 hypothetical protein OED52_13900 [Rhodococcus sp. Z13]
MPEPHETTALFPPGRVTLQALLDYAASKRKMSGRKLAELAQSKGFEITHTTINGIRNGSYRFQPSDDSIRAIAWLAGVRDETAFEAAGRKPPGKPFAEELPPGVDRLGPKERKAVVEVLRVLVAQSTRIDELERERDSVLGNWSDAEIVPFGHDPKTLAAREGQTQDARESEQGTLDLPDPDGPEFGA